MDKAQIKAVSGYCWPQEVVPTLTLYQVISPVNVPDAGVVGEVVAPVVTAVVAGPVAAGTPAVVTAKVVPATVVGVTLVLIAVVAT